jgi:hypothetical protein
MTEQPTGQCCTTSSPIAVMTPLLPRGSLRTDSDRLVRGTGALRHGRESRQARDRASFVVVNRHRRNLSLVRRQLMALLSHIPR